MSSFVVSDSTVLAIVHGMYGRKMIAYHDRYFMAGAIRRINEAVTWEEWRDSGCLPFDIAPLEEEALAAIAEEPHGMEPWEVKRLVWELVKDANHKQVNWHKLRDFTDEEVWSACKCWIEQVGDASALSFDYITIIAGVKKLKHDIEIEHLRDKTWKCRCWFGHWHWFMKAEDDEWADIEKVIPKDLAA